VLPLDIEEHQPLDIDDDRGAVSVHEQVLGPELAVNEPVLAPRLHLGGQFA
jgi:hypothetical protein